MSIDAMLVHLINQPAVGPNLPISSGQGTDIWHLCHCCREMRKEKVIPPAVSPHKRILRSMVEKLLVGVEKPFIHDEVSVVSIIKPARSQLV